VTEDTSPGFQPFGFAGGLYDADTGLVHFGAREYDAGIGRWISKDPITFGGRQGNLYSYANNRPVDHGDTNGLTVYECYDRTGDMWWSYFVGFDHTWVRTDKNEVGVEPTFPGWSPRATPTDHKGWYDYDDSNIECNERPDVSEACVDEFLAKAGDQGLYFPGINACDDFVYHVMQTCRRGS
jgi:RHS repeat-associated protein